MRTLFRTARFPRPYAGLLAALTAVTITMGAVLNPM